MTYYSCCFNVQLHFRGRAHQAPTGNTVGAVRIQRRSINQALLAVYQKGSHDYYHVRSTAVCQLSLQRVVIGLSSFSQLCWLRYFWSSLTNIPPKKKKEKSFNREQLLRFLCLLHCRRVRGNRLFLVCMYLASSILQFLNFPTHCRLKTCWESVWRIQRSLTVFLAYVHIWK